MTITINKQASLLEIEAAKKKMLEKEKRPVLADFYGKLKGVLGDGLEFQKKLRDEWC